MPVSLGPERLVDVALLFHSLFAPALRPRPQRAAEAWPRTFSLAGNFLNATLAVTFPTQIWPVDKSLNSKAAAKWPCAAS